MTASCSRHARRFQLSLGAAAAVALLPVFAPLASANSIGVQIDSNGSNGATTMASSVTAGVVPQQYFNSYDVTGQAGGAILSKTGLTDSTGAATSVGFTITNNYNRYGTGTGSATGNDTLLSGDIGNDGTENPTAPPTFTFTGLSGPYNVIVYTECAAQVPTEVSLTVGSTAGSTVYWDDEQAGSAFNGTFIQSSDTAYNSSGNTVANYVEFADVTPSSGEIQFELPENGVTANGTGYGISAIQLVPAPEPASSALAVAGAALVLSRRRRRSLI